jgi:multidrug efflux pump subunit AcrB
VNPFHGLIRAFLKHRLAANLLALVLVIFGAVAATRLNTQFFPETTIPNLSIAVSWPGATAQDVSEAILDRIEPEVRFVQGVKETTSYASEGSARILLEFDPATDMDRALADVEQRLNGIADLPQDSEDPVVTRFQFFETVALVMVSGPFDEIALQGYAKEIRDRLLAGGINRVTVSGKRDQEVSVMVDPLALRQLDLTAQEIGARIVSLNQNQPLGDIDGAAASAVRVEGRVTTADGLKRIEVKSLESGHRVLLRDIAIVRDGVDDDGVQLFRGQNRSVLLDAERFATSDTLTSMATVLRVVEEARAMMPPSLVVEVFDIRARQIEQRIEMLATNAAQGFLIVIAVLLVFLNVRVAFWVAVGVPVALFATFGFMYLTGQTLNSVALVGLILVLGMLVDDAIVVGEHTMTRFESGDDPETAAEEGAKRMLLPVLASTSTTQAAFFPIFLITGTIGQILSAIPLVIIVALLASTLECFLTLPSHLKHALEAMRRDAERRRSVVGRAWSGLRRGIDVGLNRFRNGPLRWMVGVAYHGRYVTVGIAVGLFIASLGVLAGGRVGFTFFPAPEPERVFASVTFTPGLPEAQRLEALRAIEAAGLATARELQGDAPPIVVHSFSRLGQSGQSRAENLARVDVELTAAETRTVRTDAFVAAWRRAAPEIVGVERVSIAGQRGGPPGSDIDVRLSGIPVADLKRASLELQDAMEAIPGLTGVSDDLPYGKPDLILTITPRGRFFGLTTDGVARQVRAAYEGAVAMRFPRGDEEVAVRIGQQGSDRGLAGLADLMLRTPAGAEVKLSEVVDIREARAFSILQRRDGRTAVAVTANVVPGQAQADEVIRLMSEGPLAELQARYGFDYSFEGRAQTQRETFADLRIGAALALAMIYLILAFVFQRWGQPVIVMLIVPFGFIGAVFGHWAMGFDMALFSLIGLLGLSGILVNASIVLIDRMNERRASGESLSTAVIGASVDRFRALVLTTLTTIGGMAPLMFEQSLQAQFLIPIAITLSFGLGFATLLVLFLVPATVGIADDLRRIVKAAFLFLQGAPERRAAIGPRS